MSTAKHTKTIPIIEYLEDRQRTPRELFEYLLEDAEKMDKAIVIFAKDGELYYVVGCPDRDYDNAHIYWDLNQITSLMMER